jgi:ribosome-associated protein
MTDDRIYVSPELSIPASEIVYRASRSGGPGGQHVNTSSTRVELVWDVENSPSLSGDQLVRIREKLANRISGAGLLTLSSAATRSQHRNRAEVTARLAELLREALYVPEPRKKTRPTRTAREERLKAKKRRSATKKLRRPPTAD